NASGITVFAGNVNATSATSIGASAGSLTLTGVISGAATSALTKVGAGTVVFANSNTYSGRTNVNGGILSVSGSNNLGDASPTNDLAFDGGTLQASGPIASATRNVTVNGGGGTIDTNSNAVAF